MTDQIITNRYEFPLSIAQRGLYYLQHVNPDSTAYNVVLTATLKGKLNIKVFEASVANLIKKHEILRANFASKDGSPVQLIKPHQESTVSVDYVAVSTDLVATSEAIGRKYLDQPFDLEYDSLLRISIVDDKKDCTKVVICVHHIIADGMSLQLMLSELIELYQCISKGEREQSTQDQIQYPDYVIWHQEWLSTSGKLDTDLEYWEKKLSNLSRLALPYDKAATVVLNNTAGVSKFSLDRNTSQLLKQLAVTCQVSLNTILLSVFKVFLHAISSQRDIAVGVPIWGRQSTELSNVIGHFVNPLVMRTDIDPESSFREIVSQVKLTVEEGLLHQNAPIERVVERINPERVLNQTPLYNTNFVFQNLPKSRLELDQGLYVEDIDLSLQNARFDLEVQIWEDQGQISGLWIYSKSAFSDMAADKFRECFLHFATILSHQSDLPIQQHSYVPDNQLNIVNSNICNKEIDSETGIDDWLTECLRLNASKEAIICGNQNLTYEQLAKRVDQQVNLLLQRGITCGSKVAVFAYPSPDLVISFLSLLRIGAVYIPVDPNYPISRQQYILSDAEVSLILTWGHAAKDFSQRSFELPFVDVDSWSSNVLDDSETDYFEDCPANNTAYILYTSGSTGTPKGVAISRKSLQSYLKWCVENYYPNNGNGSGAFVWGSIGFDLIITSLLSPIFAGEPIYFPENPLEKNALVDFVKQGKSLKLLKMTPSHLRVLNELLTKDEMGKVTDCLIVGGEILYWSDIEPWLVCDKAPNIVNEYGPTEATVGCSIYQISVLDGILSERVPVGNAIDRCQLYVLNPYLKQLPVGVVGELYISGEQLADGYVNKEEQTKRSFIDNPFSSTKGQRLYKTGDKARYLPDGNLDIIGRSDEQVKLRGFRIELGEISSVLKQHPSVDDVCVCFDNKIFGADSIVAFITFKEGGDSRKSEIYSFLTRTIPEYMIPNEIFILDSLSLSTNGKVDSKALIKIGIDIIASQKTELISSEPLTSQEQVMLALWQRVLNKNDISIHDNFFHIGGESIKALQLVNLASKEGVVLTPKMILEHQTIHRICSFEKSVHSITRNESEFSGRIPLTPIQHWFFDQKLPNYNHFNQSVLLRLKEGADRSALRQSVEDVVSHHSTFSIRWKIEDVWTQHFDNTLNPLEWKEFDIQCSQDASSNTEMQDLANAAHRSLSIENGPVASFVMMNQGKESFLFITVHHLYIDGVSWHIFLKDIYDSYLSIVNNSESSIIQETTSFKSWSLWLNQQAQTPIWQDSVSHWRNLTSSSSASLILPECAALNIYSDSSRYEYRFPDGLSRKIQKYAETYKLSIEHILLCALTSSISPLLTGAELRVDVESNGRTHQSDDLNLSNVLGWFTAMYPVLMQTSDKLSAEECYIENLKRLKISADKISYGTNKFLSDSIEESKPAEVLFNYLGTMDPEPNDLFEITSSALGEHRAGAGERSHIFEVNSFIMNKGISIFWEYNQNFHSKSQITNCIQRFEEFLELALLCPIDEFKNDDEIVDFQIPTVDPDISNLYQSFPLTDIQHAYWMGRTTSFEMGSVACHIYQEVEFEDLEIGRLEQAFQTLICRHPMLRAIVNKQGEQVILAEVERYDVILHDLSRVDQEHQSDALNRIRNEYSHKVRDPETWPLFDICVSKLSGKYLVHFSFDLLILDGWSIHSIGKELFEIYVNPERTLPDLKFSFRDYVLALNSLKKTSRYEQAMKYWQEKVKTMPLAPELPIQSRSSDQQESRFSRKVGRLDKNAWGKIKNIAQGKGFTPSNVLLTVFTEVLKMWSESDAFTINLTRYQRLPFHEDVPNIAGDFTTLSFATVERDIGSSLDEKVSKLQSQLWEHFEHDIVSGIDVLRMLAKHRKVNSTLMPIVFTSALTFDLNEGAGIDRLGGKVTYTITQTPQVWLDHQVFEEGGSLVFYWDFVEGLFLPGMLEAMFETYVSRLKQLAGNEHAWNDSTHPSLPVSQKRLIELANTTAVTLPECFLHEPLLKAIAQHDLKVAIKTETKSISYRELGARSASLAETLIDNGAAPNQLVAVVMHKGWEQVVAVLGILRAGAAYLPIDANLPIQRINLLLETGDVKQIVTTRESWDDEISASKKTCIFIEDEYGEEKEQALRTPQVRTTKSDLAYVIFTSGSTGTPKGVMTSHEAAANTILDINQRFKVTQDDCVYGISSLSFDLSVYDIFGVLGAGGTFILPSPQHLKDPSIWLRDIESNQVTLWNSVPTLLQMLVEYTSSVTNSSSLRLALLSGDWIPVDLPSHARSLFKNIDIISLGGATEASIWSIYYPIKTVHQDQTSIPYGKALGNQSMHILQDNLQPSPLGVIGDIYIGGKGLANGYWKDSEKTNASFIIDPKTNLRFYKTGDRGRLLPTGDIEFCGRNDLQVKLNGYRIELKEIEHALQNHPLIEQSVVIIDDDKLVAYLIADLNSEHMQVPKGSALSNKLERQQFVMSQKSICTDLSVSNAVFLDGVFEANQRKLASIRHIFRYMKSQHFEKSLLPKYYYPSAGSLYPVQIYLSLCGEIYYYHPEHDALFPLERDMLVEPVDDKLASNRVYLVADTSCIAPMYGSFSNAFCHLEAGYMGQLLQTSTDRLHPTKNYNCQAVVDSFKLSKEHLVLQAFDIGLSGNLDEGCSHDEISNIARKSYRIFTQDAFVKDELLTLLTVIDTSCGVFLWVKESCIEDLTGGWYSYCQISNSLCKLEVGDIDMSFLFHFSTDIYETAGFAIFFAGLNSSGNLYETGYVCQALMNHSTNSNIGFCAIGTINQAEAKRALGISQEQEILHSLLGGKVSSEQITTVQSIDPKSGVSSIALQYLQKILPEYMVPEHYLVINEIPLSSNGKVDRKRLPKPVDNNSINECVAPESPVQQRLCRIWQDVLSVKSIGITDNFFHLGGDSLLATKLIVRIKSEFELNLPIRTLYSDPTIKDLSVHIENIVSLKELNRKTVEESDTEIEVF